MAGLFAGSMNVRDEPLPVDSDERAGAAAQRGNESPWIVSGPNGWQVIRSSAIVAYLINWVKCFSSARVL